jgi:hypothetical protein
MAQPEKPIASVVLRDSRARSIKTLRDALTLARFSPDLVRIQNALLAHRASHGGCFNSCESEPCSRFDIAVRICLEVAEGEVHAAKKLERAELKQAKQDARRYWPDLSADFIEDRAKWAIRAPGDSNHPIYQLKRLESPDVRDWNRKYPELNFHRRSHKDANPAISASYYVEYSQTQSDELLFKFMVTNSVEFMCSGWARSALKERVCELAFSDGKAPGRPPKLELNPEDEAKRERICELKNIKKWSWGQIARAVGIPERRVRYLHSWQNSKKR